MALCLAGVLEKVLDHVKTGRSLESGDELNGFMSCGCS